MLVGMCYGIVVSSCVCGSQEIVGAFVRDELLVPHEDFTSAFLQGLLYACVCMVRCVV